jgi:hypothetical protein
VTPAPSPISWRSSSKTSKDLKVSQKRGSVRSIGEVHVLHLSLDDRQDSAVFSVGSSNQPLHQSLPHSNKLSLEPGSK